MTDPNTAFRFDTRAVVIVRDDLLPWQELNVTAFLSTGIASDNGLLGEPYRDADGTHYTPMLREPIIVRRSIRGTCSPPRTTPTTARLWPPSPRRIWTWSASACTDPRTRSIERSSGRPGTRSRPVIGVGEHEVGRRRLRPQCGDADPCAGTSSAEWQRGAHRSARIGRNADELITRNPRVGFARCSVDDLDGPPRPALGTESRGTSTRADPSRATRGATAPGDAGADAATGLIEPYRRQPGSSVGSSVDIAES